MKIYRMKLSSICESILAGCRTGTSVTLQLFRGETNGVSDPSRGVFYTPNIDNAKQYAIYGVAAYSRGRPGHVRKATIRLKNPLVVVSTEEALRTFVARDILDAKLAEKLISIGAYANPFCERVIAKSARACGYDGIIYNGGLDEVVEL